MVGDVRRRGCGSESCEPPFGARAVVGSCLRGLSQWPLSGNNWRDGSRDACVRQTLEFSRLPLEQLQQSFDTLLSFFSVVALYHGGDASLRGRPGSRCSFLHRPGQSSATAWAFAPEYRRSMDADPTGNRQSRSRGVPAIDSLTVLLWTDGGRGMSHRQAGEAGHYGRTAERCRKKTAA